MTTYKLVKYRELSIVEIRVLSPPYICFAIGSFYCRVFQNLFNEVLMVQIKTSEEILVHWQKCSFCQQSLCDLLLLFQQLFYQATCKSRFYIF